ncbi:MAG: phosphatase PAP2 family protein [Nitrospirae bacterium]|nr:MAG: phosphatase PAP2 family protein [Nitrospirota bacterium]
MRTVFRSLPANCSRPHLRFGVPYATWATGACAIGAYLAILGTLLAHDFQIVLFLRSIQHPVVEHIGRIGNDLGHGVTLVLLSLLLLAGGFMTAHQPTIRAGLHGLVAHGLAGALAQIIKHLVGRPRPRYAHQDVEQWGPSFDGGFDAFPSGHSTASFAVATVLAWYFPRGKWIWYGSASFVAWSRVVKGSHFPSDVFTGALIGYLVGCLVTQGIRRWKTVLPDSMMRAIPLFLFGWMLVWVTFQVPSQGPMATFLMGLGGMAILGSLWWNARLCFAGTFGFRPVKPSTIGPNLLAGFGLACSTASFLVVVIAVMALSSYALWHDRRDTRSPTLQTAPPPPQLSRERNPTMVPPSHASRCPIVIPYGVRCISIISMYLLLYQLRGLVPLF